MTIREWLQGVFVNCGEDLALSKSEALKAIERDSALHRELSMPLMKAAIDAHLGAIWREMRNVSLPDDSRPALPTMGISEPSRLLARGRELQIQSLMDYTMPDGKRLKDCTRAEIEAHIAIRRAALSTERERLDWLDRVARLLPKPNDKVADVLREADLRRCQRLPRTVAVA